MEHDVSGTFRILDDCTAEVTGFTYDGLGPAVWWWGAPSTDNRAIRDGGRRIQSKELTRAYNGETVGSCPFRLLLQVSSWQMKPGRVCVLSRVRHRAAPAPAQLRRWSSLRQGLWLAC
jgi:hypothetical protein